MTYQIEILSLVWDALKSLLGENLRERIKPKDSAAIAKERAYKLFVLIKQIEIDANNYVSDMRDLLKSIESNESQNRIDTKKKDLQNSMSVVKTTLKKVEKALDEINPQLEIYEPDIASRMEDYTKIRAAGLSSLRLALLAGMHKNSQDSISITLRRNSFSRSEIVELITPQFDSTRVGVIRDVLGQAIKNQKRLRLLVRDFRDFLAQEFSFKDSF